MSTTTSAPQSTLVWSDWRSQIQHRITTLEGLRQWVNLTPEEEAAVAACADRYQLSITPYYASLMDRDNPNCPVRLQSMPALQELAVFPNSDNDPVGDTIYRKTNRVVHKYPDRVIILVTDLCPVYCRHCTRKYHTSDTEGTYFGDAASAGWDADFAYIESHPEIRDVLLTGGDPLYLSDTRLERIISRLRQIPHVEIVRIGSRCPVFLPQRITPELCAMLEKYHPIWLNTHFNHPKEITPEAAAACDRLLRHGIPVQNQTVLLKGINDSVETMRALLTGLLKIRVRPYYLYHCDNVVGVSHFMTTIEKGQEIMRGLIGFMTGFAVPQYVLTTPLGKIPLWEPQYSPEDGGSVVNYRGERMSLKDFLPPSTIEGNQP
ncbi:lysine 2,3-aminomutase [Anaerolineae bacterium]|nr:lysine 2,3-aminomutase [Anaerolineae bacterium]